jgi:predicted AAA+ superfamily ATPase
MLARRLSHTIQQQLDQFPAVSLLGPRQVGKATLARRGSITAANKPPADYLDLENPIDLDKLKDPIGYLSQRQDRLVILDEVQRLPGLFQVLRGIIDDRILAGQQTGHFLLLGSASIDLLKQSSESLAGRIAYIEMTPLDVLEIAEAQQTDLWLRGGFPRSLLSNNDKASLNWRNNFTTTYLERDIPLLGPRIPAETLRRFWTMLAHNQGCLLNAAQLARSLAVNGKTIASYLDLLVNLLLVRRLPPYHANVRKRLVKSPKTYIRDSGLVHSLLRIENLEQLLGHPIAGMSWEGHVVENLLRASPSHSHGSFYRTATGAEIDLILELPGNQTWAIEVKRGSVPKLERGFHQALTDVQADRAFIVYNGNERYPKGKDIEAISLTELTQQLAKFE